MKKQTKKVPPRKPAKKVPPRKPAKKVPPRKPAKKVPARKPAKKVPARKPAKKVPARKPAKKPRKKLLTRDELKAETESILYAMSEFGREDGGVNRDGTADCDLYAGEELDWIGIQESLLALRVSKGWWVRIEARCFPREGIEYKNDNYRGLREAEGMGQAVGWRKYYEMAEAFVAFFGPEGFYEKLVEWFEIPMVVVQATYRADGEKPDRGTDED